MNCHKSDTMIIYRKFWAPLRETWSSTFDFMIRGQGYYFHSATGTDGDHQLLSVMTDVWPGICVIDVKFTASGLVSINLRYEYNGETFLWVLKLVLICIHPLSSTNLHGVVSQISTCIWLIIVY